MASHDTRTLGASLWACSILRSLRGQHLGPNTPQSPAHFLLCIEFVLAPYGLKQPSPMAEKACWLWAGLFLVSSECFFFFFLTTPCGM